MSETKRLLDAWKHNSCYFCGSMDEFTDFLLLGVEAHKKNPTTKIIKMCINCKHDWISTYTR